MLAGGGVLVSVEGAHARRVAVVGGTGDQGWGLALRWAAAGWEVVIGSRSADRAQEAAARVRAALAPAAAQVVGCDNGDAVGSAGVVVLTVPFAAQRPTLLGLRDAFGAGQVLIDVTVPLATAVGGKPTELVGVWSGSAAEQAAACVPPGVDVVSAFHAVSAEHLAAPGEPLDCDVIVCGDSRDARRRIRPLVEALPGCRFVDGGPLANSRYAEAVTPLLIGLNIRYRVKGSGFRITGVPLDGAGG